jgi:hypothetical protein
MPNHLSPLGIFHTAISILALLAAVFALINDGRIVPSNRWGKLYILLTVITCLTALPIMKTGHFTAAHGVAVIILVLLPMGVYVRSVTFLRKYADYIQTVILSLTLFLSCIAAIVETLTRVPISHPIADGPNDQIIQMGMGILVILFSLGVVYQIIKIKSRKRSIKTPDSTVKFG